MSIAPLSQSSAPCASQQAPTHHAPGKAISSQRPSDTVQLSKAALNHVRPADADGDGDGH